MSHARVALVTGGNQGVGLQLVKELTAPESTSTSVLVISIAAEPPPEKSETAPSRSSWT